MDPSLISESALEIIDENRPNNRQTETKSRSGTALLKINDRSSGKPSRLSSHSDQSSSSDALNTFNQLVDKMAFVR